jgi:monoamine oxidase
MQPEERRRTIVTALENLFGRDAADPTDYVEQDWSQETWTRGCPTGFTTPGTLSAFGSSLREPVGRIHWAGTETATQWAGYMEGAIVSGERAAGEVLARL